MSEDGIKPKCIVCRQKLEKAGALLFSPPNSIDNGEEVGKYHICSDCWSVLKNRWRVEISDV